ncbi:TetR/AcrR family transcriptional regulator [Kitasatospora camelliae]|uniref:TetR family transcriptional regulator C-terminal domain-containing protein n=1 Tax=Kitasatospora camelliae TaxID=3156397 RepID=A0AAU8JT63_9ACTN
MGRTSTARERLLDSACELLHTRGYTAVGVAEICARAEVKKGSFYHFFASKQVLTLAAVDAYWEDQRTAWTATLTDPADAPLDRLRKLLAAQVEAQRLAKIEGGAVNGCLLGNLALELSGHEPEIQRRLAEIFDEQTTLVAAVLAEAAATGRIPAARAAHGAARAVIAQLEGAVLLAKLADDPAALDGLWPTVEALIG